MTNARRRRQTRNRLTSGSRYTTPWPPAQHNAMVARARAVRRIRRRFRPVARGAARAAQAFAAVTAAFGHRAALAFAHTTTHPQELR